ncbi:MAG: bacteriochlorophyll/chlorophyll a synthase, partial [Pseudomonadota bacterium]
ICGAAMTAQIVVIALLALWDRPQHAAGVALVLLLQFWAMRIMFRDPKAKAPWYNGTGVLLYVSGMMVAAFALRGLS